MSEASREARLNAAFVTLADTLTNDYDVIDLLHVLVEESTGLLDADAGGVMLADMAGSLQLVASTSERAELVELMQLNGGAGPCVECFRTGKPVTIDDIDEADARWSDFRAAALQMGFRTVTATPLKLRSEVIGALNLFGTRPGVLGQRDATTAQALAAVATIGILQERLVREASLVSEQLQHALDSRILIEQAKGVLAEAESLGMDEAFATLRGYARDHQLTLRTVSEGVVERSIHISIPATAGSRGPEAAESLGGSAAAH